MMVSQQSCPQEEEVSLSQRQRRQKSHVQHQHQHQQPGSDPAHKMFPAMSPEVIAVVCEYCSPCSLNALLEVSRTWRLAAERRLHRDMSLDQITALVCGSNTRGQARRQSSAANCNGSLLTQEMDGAMPMDCSAGSLSKDTTGASGKAQLELGLQRLLRVGMHVKRLSVKITTENPFQAFSQVGSYVAMRALPNLQLLRIVRNGQKETRAMDAEAINQIIMAAPPSVTGLHLRVRQMSDSDLYTAMEMMENLTELHLACPAVTDQGITTMCSTTAAKSLQRLMLVGDYCMSPRSMAALATLPSLTRLIITCRAGLPPETFQALAHDASNAHNFASLRFLGFDAKESPDWAQALSPILASMGRLENILVGGSGVLDHRLLCALATHCGRTLRSITFHECRHDAGITNNTLVDALRRMPFLEKLEILETHASAVLKTETIDANNGTVTVAPPARPTSWVTPAIGVAIAKACPKIARVELGSDAQLNKSINEVIAAVRQWM